MSRHDMFHVLSVPRNRITINIKTAPTQKTGGYIQTHPLP